MAANEPIYFERDGKVIAAYVLARDSDPTCSIWVVDARAPDVDYMVLPREIRDIGHGVRWDAVA